VTGDGAQPKLTVRVYPRAQRLDRFLRCAVFGPKGEKLDKGVEVADLVARYSGRRLFQARIVRREALVDIAAALKGIDLKSFGNTR
jgi:hypothetical protein